MKLDSPLKEQYGRDRRSILKAQRAAQEIAFAPFVFQVSRMMIKLGVLDVLADNPKGLTLDQIVGKTSLSRYAVKVLVEASLSIGTVMVNNDIIKITKTGFYLLKDKMTRVNMDFSNDVNYLGLFNLEKALVEGKPAGLKVFGEWPTIYEGLSSLPKGVQESWFNFDHFYSDSSFEEALDIIMRNNPARLLDVGGNTGRFALQCVRRSSDLNVFVMDLPQQLEMLKKNIAGAEGAERISLFPNNVLGDKAFPEGFDVVWMSQFLDCFSEEEILHIVSNAKRALNKGGHLYIMETFWDRQKYEAASYCLTMTSVYFTAMANGNSKMYHSEDMISVLEKAGYHIDNIYDGLAFGHSVLECSL